ncbi:uncharacterized protein [Littorina saxatilis]|uniref:NodB homology domain-containing protein n=1 Tax=Littorina saxatilis TaxID=31220 RepID=A0AAN9C3I4_9CAEN
MLPQVFVAVFALSCGSVVAQSPRCVQGQNCHLPDCFCPTIQHPNFPDVKDIPQMVYFGFDDALHGQVDQFYKQLFTKSRKNPNGCPITMSLYVQDQWTSYALVNKYYNLGHEIGSHSVTHTNVDTAQKLVFEAGKQKDNLTNVGHVPRDEVVGWRSPNLKPAGDAQPEVLKRLGYTYDISLTHTRHSANNPVPWPFTLDYGYPYSCSVQPCPGFSSNHKGFWEIPVPSLYNPETHYPCAYVDSCRPSTEAAALDYLWSNFENVYKSNRAPFGLNMHAAWFFTPANLKATHAFLDRLLALDDVYVISAKQVLDWMRDPVKVSEVYKLPGWSCAEAPTRQPQINKKPPAVTTTPDVHTVRPTSRTPRPPTATSRPPTRTNRPSPGTARPQSSTRRPVPHNFIPILVTFSKHTLKPNNSNPNVKPPFSVFSPRPVVKTTTPPPTTTTAAAATSKPGGAHGDVCVQDQTCFLPACRCKSLLPPGKLAVQNTPQIVYLTFMGNVDGVNYQRLVHLLSSPSRRNPNNCPITSTFFVPNTGNYAPYLQSLRSRGNEVSMYGSQSHLFDGSSPTQQQVSSELSRFQNMVTGTTTAIGGAGVSTGYRSPTSLTLGDTLLKALKSNGVQYDSSLVTSRRVSSTEQIPWPYTLDYGWGDCSTLSRDCPSGRYPGLWEVPIVPLVDHNQQFVCTYADACYNNPRTSQDTYNYFIKNLEHNMNTNRAPLGIHLRKDWFYHPFYLPNLRGLEMFLDTILKTRKDVYVTSVEKMLDWMKNPTGLSDIDSFQPWNC